MAEESIRIITYEEAPVEEVPKVFYKRVKERKEDIEDLIFEAPLKSQQVWLIKEYGTNVNLGNIAFDNIISLETIRLGLRGDTLLHFNKKN